MNSLNQQFLLSMLIIFVGYVGKKLHLVQEEDGECLSRIVFNITLPALIVSTFSTMKIDFSLIIITAISVVYGISMAILSLFLFKKEASGTRGMLSMILPGFNIGLFAFPLVEAIWGQEGLKYFGMFDIGNAFILFGVCYLLASYFSDAKDYWDYKSIFVKLSQSIPLVAYMLVLVIILLGLQIPGVVIDVAKVIGKANMPLSLLLLGIYVNFSVDATYCKNMLRVLAFRYSIGLLVGTVLFFVMPFGTLFNYTVLIGLILPIGMAVIPFSTEFSYDANFVGTVTNVTLVISFLLIWIITGLLPPVS